MDVDEKSEVSAAQIKVIIRKFIRDDLDISGDEVLASSDEEKKWLDSVSDKAEKIQKVTHVLKFTNPDANGTDLYVSKYIDMPPYMVGTHALGKRCTLDTTARVNPKTGKANNAAIPKNVCEFMDLDLGGETLASLAWNNDKRLKAALSENDSQASSWMTSFASIMESKDKPSSHTLSKQIYWPIGKSTYHLLAPLFPTSLAQHVTGTIINDRFSPDTKLAREARAKKLPYSHGYREYLNVAIQKFGGTKAQNVSKLNSARRGENHLLPSLPPQWNSNPLKPPLKVDSVFDGPFGRRRSVRELVKTLREFLYSVKDVSSNMRIRNKRIELMGYLVDEVLLFAAELRELDALWSLHPDCKLNIDEQCWLNPERAKTDPEFSAKYIWADWQENVCKRFASWLNAQLSNPKKPLPFDDDSARQWRRDLKKELNMLRVEVTYYD